MTKVHIVCRNYNDDRVLPRFARHLANGTGWSLGKSGDKHADVNYLMGYFEDQKLGKARGKTDVISYMTHYEEGTAKGRLYDKVASTARVRIAMNEGQRDHLEKFGATEVLPLPLERDRFTLAERHNKRPAIGFSGFTYHSGRKNASAAERLTQALQNDVEFKASGRGWPCAMKRYKWQDMPGFFQSIDIYVCTATLEGGPMTTLEALATGAVVVIPDSVGIHPQIPDTPGIFKYRTGDYTDLELATEQAIDFVKHGKLDRQELRAATHPHSVEAWVTANVALMEKYYGAEVQDLRGPELTPDNHGVYMVAFGRPARNCARRAIATIHQSNPGLKVALCSDKPLGPEDILIRKDDADIGGRIAKLKVYDFAPQEWQYILYLDADIEVHGDATFYFKLVRDGWEFAICKDAHLHDTMFHFQRRNNKEEYTATINELGTQDALQINGGAWSFKRCNATRGLFERWYTEWDKYRGRDQGALIRALYSEPVRVFWLANEWNTLITLKGEEYPPGIEGSAGFHHFVGQARRWVGQVPKGKGLTDDVAWQMVERYMSRDDWKDRIPGIK